MVPNFMFALREDLRNEVINEYFIPKQGEPKASGWDVRAAMHDRKTLVVKPFEMVKIPLGFRALPPDGWWFELKPRCSTFAKKHLHALYGTIDETYEGELVFAAQYIPPYTSLGGTFDTDYLSKYSLEISFGDAIGQIIPVKRQEMITTSLSNEEYDRLVSERSGARGTGGFGSTGR